MVGGRVGLRNPQTITESQLPDLAISETFVVSGTAAMLALPAQTGDVAVRTDESRTYKLRGSDPTLLGEWQELLSPASTSGTLLAHASTHYAGGTDELVVQSLSSGPALAEQLLITDGFGGLSLIALTSVSGIFGSSVAYVEELIESTTTSTAFQEKLTLPTSLVSGDYLILWYAEVKSSSASSGRNISLRVQVNDTTTIAQSIENTNDYSVKSGFSIETLSSGNHYVDIDYARDGGLATAYIRNTKISLWRIS